LIARLNLLAGPIAIVLTGGGARGAYQAGCLHALFSILEAEERLSEVRILCGNSAGSINSSFLAAHSINFRTYRFVERHPLRKCFSHRFRNARLAWSELDA
jgi:predicted acylesterase/phospholipase RssA